MNETVTVYPRFIGVDSNADFVWELENGRWTWGDDPFQAASRQRTFTPDRYEEKYGPVSTQPPFTSRITEAQAEPTALIHVRNTVWAEALDDLIETRGRLTGDAYTLSGVLAHVRSIVGQPGAEVEKLPEPVAPLSPMELVSRVLYSLLVNLDGWIEGAHSNHEGGGHRGEARGEECWRQFAPADIRNMINDVAREFGVSEFPRPDKGKEDTYR